MRKGAIKYFSRGNDDFFSIQFLSLLRTLSLIQSPSLLTMSPPDFLRKLIYLGEIESSVTTRVIPFKRLISCDTLYGLPYSMVVDPKQFLWLLN